MYLAGINKPDVRFVMHFSVPKSLEGYHQVTHPGPNPLSCLADPTRHQPAGRASCYTNHVSLGASSSISHALGLMLGGRLACLVVLQETGRAGRDGKTAVCILYYSYGDAVRMRHMLKQSAEEQATSPAQLQCNMDSLNQMASPHLPVLAHTTG